MQIVIKLTSDAARRNEYFLRKRYNSKASLEKLAKVAILREVSSQAEKELRESLNKV